VPKKRTKRTTKPIKSKTQNSLLARITALSTGKKMALFIVVALLLSIAITPLYLKREEESAKAKAWTISVPARSGDTAIKYGFCFKQGSVGSVVGYVVKPSSYSNGIVYIKRFGPGQSGNPGPLKQNKASYGVWWDNQVKATSIDGLENNNWYELSYTGSNGKTNVTSSSGPILGFFIPSCL
jgi:hypothetical protein